MQLFFLITLGVLYALSIEVLVGVVSGSSGLVVPLLHRSELLITNYSKRYLGFFYVFKSILNTGA